MSDLPPEGNPYWHSAGQPHRIDLDSVRAMCFELYNIFAASGALAGQFEFAQEGEEFEHPSLLRLHHELAEKRAGALLLTIAMLVRTYDDIMGGHDPAPGYAEHSQETSGLDLIGTIDTGPFGLREACNKIIHAAEVRPVYDSSERDRPAPGTSDRVWALRGEIELAGTLNKRQWNAVLYVPPFLEIVLDRLAFGWGPQEEV